MTRLKITVHVDDDLWWETDKEVDADVRLNFDTPVIDSGRSYMHRTWERTGENILTVQWRDAPEVTVKRR